MAAPASSSICFSGKAQLPDKSVMELEAGNTRGEPGAAGYKILAAKVIEELKSNGASDIKVKVGGIIPPGDYEFLKNAGGAEIFGPETWPGNQGDRLCKQDA
jgi:hypothetical protein